MWSVREPSHTLGIEAGGLDSQFGRRVLSHQPFGYMRSALRDRGGVAHGRASTLGINCTSSRAVAVAQSILID